jgi:type IV secretory pathway TraG/TraD family ATPase VirD4
MSFFRGWIEQGTQPVAAPQVGLSHADLRSPFWSWILGSTDGLGQLVGTKRDPKFSHRVMLGAADGELALTDQDTSVLVLGPPRSTGKTAGVIIPAILTARGPVVAVSTKPDVAIATALHRRRSGKVFQFCPDGSGQMAGFEQIRWSPIGGDWGDCLARSSWMVQAANMSKDARANSSFWESRASDLLAVMLFYAGLRGKQMGWLVETIAAMRLKEDFLPIVEDLTAIGHSIPAGLLRGIIMGGDRTRADIFATASVVLRPYLLPGALASTEDPNFDIEAFVRGKPDEECHLLEQNPANGDYVDGTTRTARVKPWKHWYKQRGLYYTIYISASEENMSLVAPLIVGFLGDIQREIYRQHRENELAGRGRNAAVLWAIDELASVPIPNLPTLLRDAGSQGLLILGALQSLTQTAKWGDEGKSLQTLFNNVLVLPGIRDRETLELLSLLVGEFDREVWSGSYSRRDKEWQSSQSWQRMARLAPDDIYRGNPMDRDAALVFSRNGWQWVTLQLYYRTPPWPALLLDSTSYARRLPSIAVQGLPFPDLARGGDFTWLERISPALARNYSKLRGYYYSNIEQWHMRLASDHAEALEANARFDRGLGQ